MTIMTGCKECFRYLLLIPVIVLLFYSCKVFDRKEVDGPKGYDLGHPRVIKLPTELDEISGLAYYPKDTCVFAIVDEAGLLYKIFLNHPKQIEKWHFGDKSDYEDLVLLDSNFYVLKSKGKIAAFRFINADTLAFSEYPLTAIGKGNEFEILYYDDKARKLVMICKDCEVDKKKHLTGFTFDPFTFKYDTTSFRINVKLIAELAGEEKMKFKPSAAAISPVTGELFIVSSINKLLVIAHRDGKPKRVYKLDRKDFKQPEGLAFMSDGTLLISNEAAEHGVANILVFPYNQANDQKK